MYKVNNLKYICISTIIAGSIRERRRRSCNGIPPFASVYITVNCLKQSSYLFSAKGGQKSKICVVRLDVGMNHGDYFHTFHELYRRRNKLSRYYTESRFYERRSVLVVQVYKPVQITIICQYACCRIWKGIRHFSGANKVNINTASFNTHFIIKSYIIN
jgi:hypothetical protein